MKIRADGQEQLEPMKLENISENIVNKNFA